MGIEKNTATQPPCRFPYCSPKVGQQIHGTSGSQVSDSSRVMRPDFLPHVCCPFSSHSITPERVNGRAPAHTFRSLVRAGVVHGRMCVCVCLCVWLRVCLDLERRLQSRQRRVTMCVNVSVGCMIVRVMFVSVSVCVCICL